jgi:hypothetical protein
MGHQVMCCAYVTCSSTLCVPQVMKRKKKKVMTKKIINH